MQRLRRTDTLVEGVWPVPALAVACDIFVAYNKQEMARPATFWGIIESHVAHEPRCDEQTSKPGWNDSVRGRSRIIGDIGIHRRRRRDMGSRNGTFACQRGVQ